ncbi:response regulator [Tumidithrix elongata RA019]|uniref:Response regulator n=1 Tax=Tumidithrix elongata BACA0141 TaxID=2716417 RepID=A0AAW9Q0L3_9CYAN|nr:response regulator [Tumidithrix elongata RA019]
MNTTNTDKRLLFIDDEENIRQIVGACLEYFSDWKPTIAASGKDGLEAIAESKPDAILLDVMMPDMDGFTFLQELQSDPALADIPVVLLTSRTDLTEPHRISQLGVKGAIAKPFSSVKLVLQIAKILGW